MLRVIGFDPGAIDGEVGPLTETAVRDFQRCVNLGVLHADATPVPESGELDGATASALCQAFVAVSSPTVAATAMHPTHAEVGCTEYNPLVPDSAAGPINRRVSLSIVDSLPPHHDAAPCTRGDHDVCPVTSPENDCLWYREHYVEIREQAAVFFDFQWLALRDGAAYLSVLTNLPCETEVEFRLWRRVRDYRGAVLRGTTAMPARGDAVGAPWMGTVRNGICHAHWSPVDDWSPFEIEGWFGDGETESGLFPPLFSVSHADGWAYSMPPGIRLDRLIFSGRTPPGAIVMLNTGSIVRIPDGVDRVPTFDHVHLDEHPMAVGASLPDAWLVGGSTDG